MSGSRPDRPPLHGTVVAVLAAYGDRRPDEVPEDVDSMELAWLVHQIDQRYGYALDADDAALASMNTVSGVARVLARYGLEPETAHE